MTTSNQQLAQKPKFSVMITTQSYQNLINNTLRDPDRARSIKREIAAGRDVAFWLDKAYTHYDNGLLDEADIAEVETLAQAYYDAVDARESADEVTETPDVPEVDGAENTTDEENDTNEKESETNEG